MTSAAASPYHEGELAVQAQAGVPEAARRVGQMIQAEIPPRAAAFLTEQPLAFAATIDDNGQVWASLLSGEPGFLQPRGATTLQIRATPHPGDALADTFRRGGPIGLLAIDPERRWRMRLNGVASPLPDGGITVATEQVYANCPKYIQMRQPVATQAQAQHGTTIARSHRLDDAQQRWIAAADTFVIASYHAGGGADASHRGGLPGFVRVLNEQRLAFPDYAGNTMFNTLGNLAADPRVGLLFIDFARGDVLQVTGQARIAWERGEVAALGIAEAERAVEVVVSEVVDLAAATPWRWRLVEYSRFNPAVTRPD